MSERIDSAKVMSKTTTDLRDRLLAARRGLLTEVQTAKAQLLEIADNRESELEERAQGETAADLLARLNARRTAELAGIEAALARIADGNYGSCARCGKRIPVARLRAVPSAETCGPCAAVVAAGRRTAPTLGGRKDASDLKPVLPSSLAMLDDLEIGELVRERLYERSRGALDHVRVSCRHGVIRLTGEVGDEALRHLALRIVEDELDLEVVDRMRVAPFTGEPNSDLGESTGFSADELLDRAISGGESSESIESSSEADELGYESV